MDAADLAALAAAGFTRVSFGMQSAVPHVLATLDRTHDPERVPQVVRWAREAGLAVSLDLIYGTPGESVDDWRRSVEAALDTGVDHLSAYALVVEEGTRMGALVRRGVLDSPDPDDQATKYELVDELASAAGLAWYEVSNWARPGAASRHNEAYWRSADWWGIGPGAHSHVGAPDGAVRWWNVKHPRPYAERLAEGRTPAAGREVLGADDVRLERVLLGVRMAGGLPLAALSGAGRRGGGRAGRRRPGGGSGSGARPRGAHPAGAAAGRRRGAGADRLTVVDHVPHDWLFPRVAAAVHHRGGRDGGGGARGRRAPGGPAVPRRPAVPGAPVLELGVGGELVRWVRTPSPASSSSWVVPAEPGIRAVPRRSTGSPAKSVTDRPAWSLDTGGADSIRWPTAVGVRRRPCEEDS